MLQKSSRYDVSSAQKYGSIIYMFDDTPFPFAPNSTMETFIFKLVEKGFDPLCDAICLTGPSILVAQLMAAVCCSFDKVKLLMFSAPDDAYKLRTLNIKGVRDNARRINRSERRIARNARLSDGDVASTYKTD